MIGIHIHIYNIVYILFKLCLCLLSVSMFVLHLFCAHNCYGRYKNNDGDNSYDRDKMIYYGYKALINMILLFALILRNGYVIKLWIFIEIIRVILGLRHNITSNIFSKIVSNFAPIIIMCLFYRYDYHIYHMTYCVIVHNVLSTLKIYNELFRSTPLDIKTNNNNGDSNDNDNGNSDDSDDQ
jgi:hypothetical protein